MQGAKCTGLTPILTPFQGAPAHHAQEARDDHDEGFFIVAVGVAFLPTVTVDFVIGSAAHRGRSPWVWPPALRLATLASTPGAKSMATSPHEPSWKTLLIPAALDPDPEKYCKTSIYPLPRSSAICYSNPTPKPQPTSRAFLAVSPRILPMASAAPGRNVGHNGSNQDL